MMCSKLRILSIISVASLMFIGCGGTGGTDGIGSNNPDGGVEYDDQDGDGISDDDEGRAQNIDTDGDGTPDYLDTDSDGDGVSDMDEAGDSDPGTSPVDSDRDGTADYLETDSDDNGTPDGDDGIGDIDGDGTPNFADMDDDGDNLLDVAEMVDGVPVDSDGDGIWDYQDTDSDNDNIYDLHESTLDGDGDLIPAYLDDDSDGDCIGDIHEAGDDDITTAPVDTDGDFQPDTVDLDSDNDGLLDSLEDTNCDGVTDVDESSRTNTDTDGDGASDLIEQAAGTDPANSGDNPTANGDFVFVVPYQQAPSPTSDTLDFATEIVQADVAYAVDTTGSMRDEIDNIKASLGSLISSIQSLIPNTAFAVAGYEDFPTDPYGSAGNEPFYLLHRAMTASTAAGIASLQAEVDSYSAGGGNDGPESGWEMLYQIATGLGTTEGGATVPSFDVATAHPAAPPAGESIGTIGGVGFRTGSLPIVVWVTDACNHNSETHDPYTGIVSATQSEAIFELQELSARVIAVVSNSGACNSDAVADAMAAVTATNAVVPPNAWGDVTERPGTCAVGSCCTGIDGAGQAARPEDGLCPLLFRVDAGTGAGLGDSVATAVSVLAQYAEFDIGGVATDDPSDGVDAVASFVDKVEANATAAAPCAAGMTVIDTTGDTVNDTFEQVLPGLRVCFDVVPKMNTTVEPLTTPQLFKAEVTVTADGVTTLDTREIWFLVPPTIPVITVD